MHGNSIRGWLVFAVAVCGCDSGNSAAKSTDSTDQSPTDSTDPSAEAFNTYRARSKGAEAKSQLAKAFDGATASFREEHVERGGSVDQLSPHRCPGQGSNVDSGITPPLSVDCNAGPKGRCIPDGGAGPGHYAADLWANNEVWSGLDFMQERGHYFHYRFLASNDESGFGACQFTIQAFADLDGDGLYSTYERKGTVDIDGFNPVGLYIDHEVE